MSSMVSRRASAISAFHVMDILAKARRLEQSGRSVCHLEIGEPDMPTPDTISAAGINSIKNRRTFYTQATGLPELRQAIADYYTERYEISLPFERIIVTPGASGAIQLALLSLLDCDDEILLPDPGYPCNRNIAQVLDVQVTSVPVDASTGFHLSADHVESFWSDKTRAAMVATPSNPTGTMIENTQLSQLHRSVSERGGTLIVDEIYQGLVYDQADTSVLQLVDNCIVINSFSKYFAMTGWRIGWMVVPEWLVDAIDRIAQNLFLAPPTMAQYAAMAALDPVNRSVLNERRDIFKQRRDYLLPALEQLGFSIPQTPRGAFYIYADSSQFSQDSFNWCSGLLDEQAVAVTPGVDFGNYRADQFCRFAYTQPLDVLEQAVDRIGRYIQAC